MEEKVTIKNKIFWPLPPLENSVELGKRGKGRDRGGQGCTSPAPGSQFMHGPHQRSADSTSAIYWALPFIAPGMFLTNPWEVGSSSLWDFASAHWTDSVGNALEIYLAKSGLERPYYNLVLQTKSHTTGPWFILTKHVSIPVRHDFKGGSHNKEVEGSGILFQVETLLGLGASSYWYHMANNTEGKFLIW